MRLPENAYLLLKEASAVKKKKQVGVHETTAGRNELTDHEINMALTDHIITFTNNLAQHRVVSLKKLPKTS